MQTSDAFKLINLYAYPAHFLNRYIIATFNGYSSVFKLFELHGYMVVVFIDCFRVLGLVIPQHHVVLSCLYIFCICFV